MLLSSSSSSFIATESPCTSSSSVTFYTICTVSMYFCTQSCTCRSSFFGRISGLPFCVAAKFRSCCREEVLTTCWKHISAKLCILKVNTVRSRFSSSGLTFLGSLESSLLGLSACSLLLLLEVDSSAGYREKNIVSFEASIVYRNLIR